MKLSVITFQAKHSTTIMKYFVSVVVLFAVVGSLTAVPVSDASDDLSVEDLHQIKKEALTTVENFIQDTLKEMGEDFCKDKQAELQEKFKEVTQRAESVDIESETVCALVEHKLAYVFEPLTTIIDECGKDKRYGNVATSVITLIKSIVKFMCTSTGEEILELFNPCTDKFDIENSQCAKDFDEKFDGLSPVNTSGTFVEELCKILPNGKQCLEQELTKCKHQITRNTWMKLYEATMVPCQH